MSIRIVFLDRATFPKQVEVIRPKIPHQWIEYSSTAPEQIVTRCRGAQVIVTNKVALTGDVIDKLPDLDLIAITATGTNNIDFSACKKNGVTVKNVVNYGTDSVAEHTWCLILNLFRQFIPYRESILEGKWNCSKNFSYFLQPVKELAGARIAIVGAGVLGRRVGKLATAFNMDTVYVVNPKSPVTREQSKLKLVSLDQALKTSDVISIHCPLTPQTRNLITIKEIRKMKSTAFLVNTSRGGIVNESDLAQALKEKLLNGAAFDVLSIEPPTPSHVLHRLRRNPRFILTPHMAWVGEHSLKNLLNSTVVNIESYYKSRRLV